MRKIGPFAVLIRRFTVDQWLAIDTEYLKSRTDLKGIISLVLVVFLLIIQRYYGRPGNFTEMFGNSVNSWLFPEIWARLYNILVYLIIYFAIPSIFIRFVFHERIKDHGFKLRGITRYIWLYVIVFLVMLPLIIIASFSSSFATHYPLYSNAGNSWAELLIWESAYGAHFLALEFFFRGFMLFAMARYIGAYAIFVMVIPYAMIHFGKPFAETIGSIIAGIFLGTLALRTRTMFGGAFIHIAVAWTMDILALLQTGQWKIDN